MFIERAYKHVINGHNTKISEQRCKLETCLSIEHQEKNSVTLANLYRKSHSILYFQEERKLSAFMIFTGNKDTPQKHSGI